MKAVARRAVSEFAFIAYMFALAYALKTSYKEPVLIPELLSQMGEWIRLTYELLVALFLVASAFLFTRLVCASLMAAYILHSTGTAWDEEDVHVFDDDAFVESDYLDKILRFGMLSIWFISAFLGAFLVKTVFPGGWLDIYWVSHAGVIVGLRWVSAWENGLLSALSGERKIMDFQKSRKANK